MSDSALMHKIEAMSTQGMSFSNNGQVFTLSVPDASQVQEAFAALTKMAAGQQAEMESMREAMGEMKREFASGLSKTVQWAEGNLSALNSENKQLRDALVETQGKLQNLTFNMQGIDDITFVDLKKPKLLTTILCQLDEQNGLNVVTDKGVDKNIMAKRKALDREHAYFTDKSLGSLCEFPKDSRQRWLWAIKTVIKQNRLKNLGVNFTRAKVNKLADSSVASRLERLERQLFVAEEKAAATTKAASAKLEDRIVHVKESTDLDIHTLQTGTESRLKGVDTSVANMRVLLDEQVDNVTELRSNSSDTNQAIDDIKASMSLSGSALDATNDQLTNILADVEALSEAVGSGGMPARPPSQSSNRSSRPSSSSRPDTKIDLDAAVGTGTSPRPLSSTRGGEGLNKRALNANKQKLMSAKEYIAKAKTREQETRRQLDQASDIVKASTTDPYNPDSVWVLFDNEETASNLSYYDLVSLDSQLRNGIMQMKTLRDYLNAMQTTTEFVHLDVSASVSDRMGASTDVKEVLDLAAFVEKEIRVLISRIAKNEPDYSEVASFVTAKCGQFVEYCSDAAANGGGGDGDNGEPGGHIDEGDPGEGTEGNAVAVVDGQGEPAEGVVADGVVEEGATATTTADASSPAVLVCASVDQGQTHPKRGNSTKLPPSGASGKVNVGQLVDGGKAVSSRMPHLTNSGSGRGHNVSEIGPLITRLCRLENKLADYEDGQGAHMHIDHSHDYDENGDVVPLSVSASAKGLGRRGSGSDRNVGGRTNANAHANGISGEFTTKEDVCLIVDESLTEWHERFTGLLDDLKEAKHHHHRGESPSYAPANVDLDELPDDFGADSMDVGDIGTEEDRKKFPAYVFSENDGHVPGHGHGHGPGHGHGGHHHAVPGSPMDRHKQGHAHAHGRPKSTGKDSISPRPPSSDGGKKQHEEPVIVNFDLLGSKDFKKVQESIDNMRKQLDVLSHAQHEAESDHSTTHAKLSKFELSNLNTGNMIESLEDTCRKLALAMRDIERTSQQEQEQMKRERALAKNDLHDFVSESIDQALAKAANGAADSYTTTKAMCLGCGRDSTVRHLHPKPTPAPDLSTNPNYGGFRQGPSRPASPEKIESPMKPPTQQHLDDVDDHLSVMTGDSGGFEGVGAVRAEKSTIEVEVENKSPSPAIGGIIQFPVITQSQSPPKTQHIPLIHPAINQQLNRGLGGINTEAQDILQPTLQVERAALDAQRQQLSSSGGRNGNNKPRTANGKREVHSLPARRVYGNLVEDTGGPTDATVNALQGTKSNKAAVRLALISLLFPLRYVIMLHCAAL